jgi:hypothetical protein
MCAQPPPGTHTYERSVTSYGRPQPRRACSALTHCAGRRPAERAQQRAHAHTHGRDHETRDRQVFPPGPSAARGLHIPPVATVEEANTHTQTPTHPHARAHSDAPTSRETTSHRSTKQTTRGHSRPVHVRIACVRAQTGRHTNPKAHLHALHAHPASDPPKYIQLQTSTNTRIHTQIGVSPQCARSDLRPVCRKAVRGEHAHDRLNSAPRTTRAAHVEALTPCAANAHAEQDVRAAAHATRLRDSPAVCHVSPIPAARAQASREHGRHRFATRPNHPSSRGRWAPALRIPILKPKMSFSGVSSLLASL